MTAVDAASGRVADLLVQTAPGTPFGAVRAPICGQLARAAGPVSCGGRLVRDEEPMGSPPLVHGVTVTLGEPQRDGCGAPRTPSPANPEPGVLELHVRSGPDAGAVRRLLPGNHVIGRAPTAAVPVEDPDVSRAHAVVSVGEAGAVVRDLGSTNGTTVGGVPVGPDGSSWRPDEVLRVGSTSLTLHLPRVDPASSRPSGAGVILVNRRPRHICARPELRFELPAPDPEPPRARLPLLALGIPLALGLTLAALTRNTLYLMFALMSPAMLVGTYLSDRVQQRRARQSSLQRAAGAEAAVRQRIAGAVAAESARRHADFPGPAETLLVVRDPRPRLWERRPEDPDFLVLRTGMADLPSTVEVRRPGSQPSDVDRPLLRDVPVTVPLATAGVLGVAGPRGRAVALTRFLLAQVTAWHSPAHVDVVVLAQNASEWSWLRWAPHTGEDPTAVRIGAGETDSLSHCLGALSQELDERLAEASGPRPAQRRRVVVSLLDGAGELRRIPSLARLLRLGPAVGLYFLCLDEDVLALPVECRSTMALGGAVATRLTLSTADGSRLCDVTVDGVGPGYASRFGRALAPLRDATPNDATAAPPATARLLDLLRLHPPDVRSVSARWGQTASAARLPIGVSAGGDPFVIDLASDGPHVLVAGTTGAGKSELLQTLIAGLAASAPPDRLSFLLVDYKGGAAFAECARLPHTVGLVTDLDGALTERALTSLGAELRRRERLLRAAGCPDLDAYADTRSMARDPLARLVLVVDEFATLAEELPDFLGGLVGIAQRGRSLGVHLVLATQRPAGVVSPDIRANTSLRIALRVNDPAESMDVIDRADAAALPAERPGRAVIRAGGRTTAVQIARINTSSVPRAPVTTVTPWSWAQPAVARESAAPALPSDRTDLAVLVEACTAAARQQDIVPAPAPWAPPLPAVLPLCAIKASADNARSDVPFALLDFPSEQRVALLTFPLDQGRALLVAGGPGSGRTTTLRTLAGGMLDRYRAEDVHLYVFDFGGGLSALRAAAGCGAVVQRDEPQRGARLLQVLSAELDQRQQMLAERGVGDISELHAKDPDRALPWVVVLVDGWEALVETYEELDAGRPLETLLRLVREGAAAGFRFAVTGGRALLTSRLAGLASSRLLLPLPDPLDYGIAGVSSRVVPLAPGPGRAVLAPGGTAAQVALLGTEPSSAAQLEELKRLATTQIAARPGRGPYVVEPLPRRVTLEDLRLHAAEHGAGSHWALVGVGGDLAGPVGLNLAEDGPWVLVTGSSGSGRSTALITLARWLLDQERQLHLWAGPRSPLRQLLEHPLVTGLRPGATWRDVLTATAHTVIVDDADEIRDTPLEQALLDAAGHDQGSSLSFLVSTTTTDALAAFRGLAAHARRGRTGLLLGACAAGDSEVFGLRLPRSSAGPPGRGLLVVRGTPTPVQVAWPGG